MRLSASGAASRTAAGFRGPIQIDASSCWGDCRALLVQEQRRSLESQAVSASSAAAFAQQSATAALAAAASVASGSKPPATWHNFAYPGQNKYAVLHTIGQAGQNHTMNRGGSCQCGSAGFLIPSVSARALSGVSAFTLSVRKTSAADY